MQMIISITIEVNHIRSQHIIQSMSGTLVLAIRFRMKKVILIFTWIPRSFKNNLQK